MVQNKEIYLLGCVTHEIYYSVLGLAKMAHALYHRKSSLLFQDLPELHFPQKTTAMEQKNKNKGGRKNINIICYKIYNRMALFFLYL
jgi:DNA-binding MltR family transcriptional regulator